MTDKQTIFVSDLKFREISRDASSKIKYALVAKEAVHPLTDVTMLDGTRLAPVSGDALGVGEVWDKHCFGLFATGRDVPEVAVYVKLLRLPEQDGKVANASLPGDISKILNDPVAPVEKPNTAIFYTITNTAINADGRPDPSHPVQVQRGDVSPAEYLIRQVSEHFLRDQGIRNFSTLSPLRSGIRNSAQGFEIWLSEAIKNPSTILTLSEQKKLKQFASSLAREGDPDSLSPGQRLNIVRQRYAHLNEDGKIFVTKIMKDLGMYYLASEKTISGHNGVSLARDKVANFHLSNGAMIGKIHWAPPGKTTPSETVGGGGLMASYRYEPEHLAERKTAYKTEGVIAADPKLQQEYTLKINGLKLPSAQIDGATVQVSPTASSGVASRF
jgi:hypothetical protein